MASLPPSTQPPGRDSKRQILDHLKRVDSNSVSALSDELSITPTAVRQHLDVLKESGLVEEVDAVPTGGRGRPASHWRLTELAVDLFPDRHSDLTVELIEAIRNSSGDEGLDAVIASRTNAQRGAYGDVVTSDNIRDRVGQLADQRAAEGYMAEVRDGPDGVIELIEHHCPICDAASACQSLCRDELEVFRDVIGPKASVQRSSHLLSGDRRCAYVITPVAIG
ncbi:MAG: helix-turn-helix transcriptional regulator [Acidimicrobiales bacterium]